MNRRAGSTLPAVLSLMLAAILCGAATTASAQQPEKNVLIVYSHEPEALSYARLDANLRSELRAGAGPPVNFYTEYLDAMRFPDRAHEKKFLDYLDVKYGDRSVDLIVAVSPPAFDFVREHREQLFPGVPIVFTSVSAFRLEALRPEPNITGIAIKGDLTSTLDVALQLQPDTTAVVIPVGASALEKEWTAETRTMLQRYESRVSITYLGGLSMNDMLARLRSLPAHTIVLFSSLFFYDSTGQYFLPEEALQLVCLQANAPVYGALEPFLGLGIVGGRLYDVASTGTAAGQIGRRILNGEAASSIPVQALDPNAYVFDARQIRRWHLDERRLPSGAELRFQTPSIWREYRWPAIGVLAFCALQAVSLVALLVQRRRRAALEAEAKTRRAELAHLMRVSLMGELSGSLAHELNQPLTAILSNAEAAERFLRMPNPDLAMIREILHDIADDDRRAGDVIRRLRTMLKKEDPHFQSLQFADIVNGVQVLVHGDLATRDVTIDLDIAPDLPMIAGDRVALQQVVINLIVNAADAVKTAPPHQGRIKVRVRAGEGGTVRAEISDNGAGIADGDLDRIFEPFVTTKRDGLGMGLAISRTIVESHGGRLWATNNVTYGATFHVMLPGVQGNQEPGTRNQESGTRTQLPVSASE